MKNLTWFACVACLSLAFTGCGPVSHGEDAGGGEEDAGPGGGGGDDIPDVGDTSSTLIDDSAGGVLMLASLTLDVPGDAVDEDTEVSVEAIDEELPELFEAFTPVFRFEPAGLEFNTPVTVRIPFEGDAELATIYWTTDDGETYAALDTRIEGGMAVAETTHFSRAFVGTACRSGACCGRGRGVLDVLMMVDGSNSMAEEQASLSAQIPHMARVLATGDLDGDGVQDFPALRSIHVGSVTPDMGTAGYTVPTCAAADFGDDGLLRTDGNPTMTGCAATYPAYAELRGGATSSQVDTFVEQVQCTAVVGIGGCGFEQPLEATLKAVTDSMSTTTFHAGTSGHADGANAGFLRPDSILATIMMTDENDCSALDGEIFSPTSGTYTADLNLRCHAYPAALHPMARYVTGLRDTRTDPNDLIFNLIAGIPTDLAGQAPATINADPRMAEVVDPMMPNRLTPSCNTPGTGLAFPPRRMVDLADSLGGAGTIQSICQSDFTPVVDAILREVARRASGSCGP